MNIVFIIPTGIGCKIGGHAGDASPVAKMLGSICDNLIIHPNVVNASDINEMPPNAWYVEGSLLDRFLDGQFDLKKPYRNKILLAVNNPIRGDTINAVNAARNTIGAEIQIVELETPFTMKAEFDINGSATGIVNGHEELIAQISDYDFDALAIHSEIEVDRDIAIEYLKNGGVNPWGGVEAIASRIIAKVINKPVAHAPMERESTISDKELMQFYKHPVYPEIAAEVLSVAYIHCVFKGLNTAPRIAGRTCGDLGVNEIDFLVSPFGCIGRPHLSCLDAGIPVIAVRSNTTIFERTDKMIIYVDNYLEAAGLICCEKGGVNWRKR